MLKHKGYTGYVVYDDEAHIFHGEIVGIRAVITFQGTTVREIEQAFKDSIEDYLDWCKKRGKEPEKVQSGKFNLRMPPEIYVKIASQASQEGLSINSYFLKLLDAAEKFLVFLCVISCGSTDALFGNKVEVYQMMNFA